MKTLIAVLAAVVTLVWGLDALSGSSSAGAHPLWIARQEALYLSGLLSIALLSLAMLLATRPAWLESPLGGMDRIYRTHKWAGILGIAFAAMHWLVEMSDDVLKASIGRAGRLPKEKFLGLFEAMRDLAEDLGEWAIYFILAMLVITLWKKFPYRAWRYLHRAMPVLYLALAFHAAMLAPRDYWTQPAGGLLAVLLAIGIYGGLRSLLGSIGGKRTFAGEVVAVRSNAVDVTSIRCQLGNGWRGHRPGQFAFVTFDECEGPHPFTIASADHGDGIVNFEIKALGDYTRRLPTAVQAGQAVRVEGPYGRFDMARCNAQDRQIWIAGGVGITPFLAWLESLQQDPGKTLIADLHYCTRDASCDAFVPRLQGLCAPLAHIRLYVHDTRQGDTLKADALDIRRRAEVWFCGPVGLAEILRNGLQAMGHKVRFHQEAFEMR